jgi:hypothetical protein
MPAQQLGLFLGRDADAGVGDRQHGRVRAGPVALPGTCSVFDAESDGDRGAAVAGVLDGIVQYAR